MPSRIGRSSSHSPRLDVLETPPPPYREPNVHHPPVLLAETTTTRTEIVTTTTQTTTTHFFSFPQWGKRRTPVPSTDSPRQDADESGILMPPPTTSVRLMLEKDLPPTPATTPPSESVTRPSSREGGSILDDRRMLSPRTAKTLPNLDVAPDSSADIQTPTVPAFTALAHATLGIGLPPVLSGISASPSTENAFARFADAPGEHHAPVLGPRKVKSTVRLRSTTNEGGMLDSPIRRTRGLSLIPGGLLSSQSEGKGKERELDQPSTPSLSRRASFWSRKKTDNGTPVTPRSRTISKSANPTPALPYLPPVSPFNMGAHQPSSSDELNKPRLVRSRSERASLKPFPRDVDQDTPRSLSRARPSTGDPAQRARAQSSFGISSSPAPVIPSSHDTSSPTLALPRTSTSSTSSKFSVGSSAIRPRSSTNPPLLNRLSVNLSALSPFSPSPASKNNNILSNSISTSPVNTTPNSPRTSLQRTHPAEIPKPEIDAESPELYLRRLTAAVSKAEIGTILASSPEPFYANALKTYLQDFNFVNDPLDVAIRKLLMDVSLPRETQQIDRIMEAFADRYRECNPRLFISRDHPYIIAFSLIMLHTDAFNKSNKRKMTKPDYVKNTRLSGVFTEVLECFYDNIVFAPFIFIEDPVDVNGHRGVLPEISTRKLSTFGSAAPGPINHSSASLLGKAPKIDPYYMIMHNQLDHLRVNVTELIPIESPYHYTGTVESWDEEEVRASFANAKPLEIGSVDHLRLPGALLVLPMGTPNSFGGSIGALQEIPPSTGDVWALKVTMVGILNRKDDVLEGGRKASSRKWKPWSVLLTGSQLLLFRDPTWALVLLSQDNEDGMSAPMAPPSVFKPDEIWSVKDAIAVYDASYTKHEHVMRLILPNGRQILLKAPDADLMNRWISRINYACTFKSAGVRMRSPGMTPRDIELTALAAATSHLHDNRRPVSQVRELGSARDDAHVSADAQEIFASPPASPRSIKARPGANRTLTTMSGRDDVDIEVPVAPEIEGAYQFKVTFDQVKAELANASSAAAVESKNENPQPRLPRRTDSSSSQLPSRSKIIQSKIHDLESKLTAVQSQIEVDLRFVRNVSILTPFQRSTRDRLQAAVNNIAKRVTQVRLEFVRLSCYREVLLRDLIAEERDLKHAKDAALKIATATVQSHRAVEVAREASVSTREDDENDDSLAPYESNDVELPESSIPESFFTAEPDPQSPVHTSSPPLFDSPAVVATPLSESGTNSGSTNSFPFPPFGDHSATTSPGAPTRTASEQSLVSWDERVHHEKFYTALEHADEQAEDWHKTRCAKRVSLVRVPSSLHISVGRRPTAIDEEKQQQYS